jgi:hypothetical protein
MEPLALLEKSSIGERLLQQSPIAFVMMILVIIFFYYMRMLIKDHREDMKALFNQYAISNEKSIVAIENNTKTLATSQEIWRNQAKIIETCQRNN